MNDHTKPKGLSWEHVVNDKGVSMAIINQQELVDFMVFAEDLYEKLLLLNIPNKTTELHICKYCNVETNQPDDECYKKPLVWPD